MTESINRCRPLLGTLVEASAQCANAVEAAFDAVERVQHLMSAHCAGSDVSRVNRSAHLRPVEVDPWTFAVLERALFWNRASGGAFDVLAAGAAALRSGYLPRLPDQPTPDPDARLSLDPAGRRVRLSKPGCIDLGGIAKGFAVDRAIHAMKVAGAGSGRVNAGGDLAAFGPDPWPVHIVEPEARRVVARLSVLNAAVATSALLPDGRSDHLPGRDPGLVSASVHGSCAMDCDALTKIVLSRCPEAVRCLSAGRAEALVGSAGGEVATIAPVHEAA